MYAQDEGNGSVFPLVYNSAVAAGQGRYWEDLLAPYVGAKGKYSNSARPYYANTAFDCPSQTDYTAGFPSDYVCFQVLFFCPGTITINDTTQIEKLAETGIIADAEFYNNANPGSAKIGTKGENNTKAVLRNWHNDGLNILYCDGHVKYQSVRIGDDLRNIFDATRH